MGPTAARKTTKGKWNCLKLASKVVVRSFDRRLPATRFTTEENGDGRLVGFR